MSAVRSRSSCFALALSGLVFVALAGCNEEAPPAELPARAIQWLRVEDQAASDRRVISGVVASVSKTKLSF